MLKLSAMVSAKLDMAEIATHRKSSIFAEDIVQFDTTLRIMLSGSRILAIGGAGSIGAATVSVIIGFGPAALHIVDQNENDLVELTRLLRAQPSGLDIPDFRTLPIDFGSAAMRLFLHSQSNYDIVLNFAAIKHVRSEKDVFSMIQMFDTNLLKQTRLLRWLAEIGFRGRYFSVSTDKAANPSSFMGASKRLMEHVMFSGEAAGGLQADIVSARFANVAFSNGSLLQSFMQRLEHGQPLAVPSDTKRYFVSIEEAGQLCTLASTLVCAGHIAVPKLTPEDNLVLLEDVAAAFLRRFELEPEIYSDEEAARNSVKSCRSVGRWPLLLTALDTAGEKPFEEFVAQGETTVDGGFPNLECIPYKPAPIGSVAKFITEVEQLFSSAGNTINPSQLEQSDLKLLVGRIEPAFLESHRSSEKSLDARI